MCAISSSVISYQELLGSYNPLHQGGNGHHVISYQELLEDANLSDCVADVVDFSTYKDDDRKTDRQSFAVHYDK